MSQAVKEHIVSTMDYPDDVEFYNRSTIIKTKKDATIVDELKHILTVLKAAGKTRAILLDSASGRIQPDLLACAIMGFWRKSRRPVIVMMGDMWHKDNGIKGKVQKFILGFADKAIVRYAPLSSEEFPFFEKSWGISKDKLRFLPYFYTFTSDDLSAPPPAQEGFIFSGGNAHRDYAPLIKAMESLPEYQLVIGSRLLDGVTLPPNVKAGQLPRPEFISKMRASRAVIVPIRKGLVRSTGHQTYLNGMLLGKPTIISDILGVREYTQNGTNAMIVDGTPEGYVAAIRWVMDPANKPQIDAMCRSAQESAQKVYTFEAHCKRLLDIIDEAVEDYFIK